MSFFLPTKHLINQTRRQKQTQLHQLENKLKKSRSLNEYLRALDRWGQLNTLVFAKIYKEIFSKKEKLHSSLCVSGSYASGSLTCRSDLDVVLFYDSRFLPKRDVERKIQSFLSVVQPLVGKADYIIFDTNQASSSDFFDTVNPFLLNFFLIHSFISGNQQLYRETANNLAKNEKITQQLVEFIYVHKQLPKFGFTENTQFHVKISPGGLLTLTLAFHFLRSSKFFSQDLSLIEVLRNLNQLKEFSRKECLAVIDSFKLLRFVKSELEIISNSDQVPVKEELLFKISQRNNWIPDGKILYTAINRARRTILNFDEKIQSMILDKLGIDKKKLLQFYKNQKNWEKLISDTEKPFYNTIFAWTTNNPVVSEGLFYQTEKKSTPFLLGLMQNPITPGKILNKVEILSRDTQYLKVRNRFLLYHPFLMKKTLLRMVTKDWSAFLSFVHTLRNKIFQQVLWLLSKLKFFGLRKVFYAAKDFTLFLKKIHLSNDIVFLSKSKKEEILSSFVKELSRLEMVEAVYNIGRKKYVSGISDLDLVVIVKKSGSYSSLKKVFYQYRASFKSQSYLFEHFPFVVTRSLFVALTRFGIIPHLNHDLTERLQCLYAKKDFSQPEITVSGQQYRLSLLEHYFLSIWSNNLTLRYQSAVSLRLMIKRVEKLFLNFCQFWQFQNPPPILSENGFYQEMELKISKTIKSILKTISNKEILSFSQHAALFQIWQEIDQAFEKEINNYLQETFPGNSLLLPLVSGRNQFADTLFLHIPNRQLFFWRLLKYWLGKQKILLMNHR